MGSGVSSAYTSYHGAPSSSCSTCDPASQQRREEQQRRGHSAASVSRGRGVAGAQVEQGKFAQPPGPACGGCNS
jgi:hypothetical protein